MRTFLIFSAWFVGGAVLAAAPFLVAGHFQSVDEFARGEPTMGPGITTALGLLAAPLGGLAALGIAIWRGRRRQKPNS